MAKSRSKPRNSHEPSKIKGISREQAFLLFILAGIGITLLIVIYLQAQQYNEVVILYNNLVDNCTRGINYNGVWLER
jgi:hypothetical protein